MDIFRALDRFADSLRVEAGASSLTISAYASDLQKFLEASGIDDTRQIKGEVVTDFVGRINKDRNLSTATVRRRIASLRSFCKFLVKEGIIRENPFPKGIRARRAVAVPKALTREEVERLLDAPDTESPMGIRDRAILEVLYASGIRVSECAGLKISDVDLDRGLVRVRGKGAKFRVALLGDYAVYWLRSYLSEVRPTLSRNKRKPRKRESVGVLFLGRKGGLSRVQIYRIIKGYALKAGIKGAVTPHVLRHSFATHLLENGADIRVVQELLGHANISTVEIYTKVTMKHLRETYDRAHPHA